MPIPEIVPVTHAGLIVENNVKKRTVDLKSAVVFGEPSTDSRTPGTDHSRQHLLADLGHYGFRLALLPEIGQQQERSRGSFLAGVEKLIDQILFDSNAVREHVRKEQFRKGRLRPKHLQHSRFLQPHDRAFGHCGRRRHPRLLPRQTSFTEEIAGPQHTYHRFFAGVRDNRHLNLALAEVEERIRFVALFENDGLLIEGTDGPSFSGTVLILPGFGLSLIVLHCVAFARPYALVNAPPRIER
jgi:hypothetical protein